MDFDIKGAKAAGYSDTQIADVLAQKAGFDAAAARKAGHADTDIIAHLSSRREPVDVDAYVNKALKDRADNMSVREAIEVGAGHTFDAIGRGMQQLYYGVTGNDKEQAALKQRSADRERLYKPMTEAHPIATAVGESLPSMVVPVGATGTALATAGKLATAAAVPAALEYGSASERAARAAGAATGAVVGGVVVPKVASVAVGAGKSALKSLVGTITPEARALAQRAEQLGIPINLAQLGDGKFLKTLASSLEQMPFTGGQKAASNQRAQFTKAVTSTFGSDADKLSPEVYEAARSKLGQTFNDLASRNKLDVTDSMKSSLGKVVADAEATGSDDTIRAVKNIVARTTEQAESVGGPKPAQVSSILDAQGKPLVTAPATGGTPTVSIPGATYMSIDSELSNIIKGGGEKGLYAKRLQNTIREAMDASVAPEDAAAWAAARAQYKNLKAVRNIIAKGQGEGDVPPTQLMHALTGTEAGKEAMALGSRGTLGELGQIGRRFVRDQVPNSGTAQRALAMGLIGGGGYAFGADPQTIAGMMVGSATAGRLMNKAIWSPKVIAAAQRKGIPLKELANMTPSRVTQILGGTAGEAEARKEQE
jgi:hypothetical protein